MNVYLLYELNREERWHDLGFHTSSIILWQLYCQPVVSCETKDHHKPIRKLDQTGKINIFVFKAMETLTH